jgi:hypothetical protein
MAATYQVLVILHVLAATMWFGMGLSLPRRLRLGLARGRPAAGEAADEVVRGARLTLVAGALAIASGLTLVLAGGGFALYPRRIHLGLGLGLVAFAIGLIGVRPAWVKVERIAAGDAPLDGAKALAKRAATLHAVAHLLQVATLVLMLWRV